VVDDAGDTVALSPPVHRIVSLIPATTELLFAIGAGPDLVGRTKWCDYPEAARAVPDVGDGIQPNLEAVLAQHPDLVLLYHSARNAAAAARLRSLGIPALRIRVDRLADVSRIGHLLGPLTGRGDAADSVARALDAALAAVPPPRLPRPPRVLLLAWSTPPMTLGEGSFVSELVERAGGTNLFADIATPDAEVSLEAIAARDPDLILVVGEGIPAFAERPEWQVVRAVRERRFVHVTSSAFNRPSPRAPDAVRELANRFGEVLR
jgi:iron complex transport system substrate-binding protein